MVEQLPEGRSFLVIDDTHETPALDGLLHAVAALGPGDPGHCRLRPYGVARILSVAQRANFMEKAPHCRSNSRIYRFRR